MNASGVQIYRCEKISNATGLEYTLVGAMASLYSPYAGSIVENHTSVGYHYYLSEPLAQGGQPTFAFSMAAGEPVSAIPESTVTGRAIFSLIFSSCNMKTLIFKTVTIGF